jgi:thioredoxin-related protein
MKNILILASASWCSPCNVLKQRLISEHLSDRFTIKDFDESPTFFKKYEIKSVPRLLIFNPDGKHLKTISGIEEIFATINY